MIEYTGNFEKPERYHWFWHLLLVMAVLLVLFSQTIEQEFVKKWLTALINPDGIKQKYFDLLEWGLLGLAAGCIVLWFFRKIITDDWRKTLARWRMIPSRVDASAIIPAGQSVWLENFLWFLLPIWGVGVAISLIPGYEGMAYRLTQERGVFETLTVVFYVFAGIVALRSAFPLFGRNAPGGLLRWWFLVLAIGCLFVAVEEINWGDMYFSYKAGEFIREVNYQDEISLHNIPLPFAGSYWANVLLQILAVCGGILLPVFVWASKSFRSWMMAIEAPLPPWISQAFFFVAALIPQDKMLQLQRANIPSELRELTVAIGVAIWLWYIMKQNCYNVPRVVSDEGKMILNLRNKNVGLRSN
jgi:hypothetical protein